MSSQEYIREYPSQKIIGIIETLDNGDQIARDFNTRMILGYYRARLNHTTDVPGKIIAKGNCVVSFIYNKR